MTAVLLAAATGLAFGFAVWASFMVETRALMTAIMEAPYPQSYHGNALTVFVMARSVGASVNVAYCAQLAATLAAIALVIRLWLPSTTVDHRRRTMITATLTIVATPYGYTYDTIPMCVAIAYMFAVTARPLPVLLGVAWLFPLFAHLLNFNHIGIGILVPIATAVWMWPRVQDAGASTNKNGRLVNPTSRRLPVCEQAEASGNPGEPGRASSRLQRAGGSS